MHQRFLYIRLPHPHPHLRLELAEHGFGGFLHLAEIGAVKSKPVCDAMQFGAKSEMQKQRMDFHHLPASAPHRVSCPDAVLISFS